MEVLISLPRDVEEYVEFIPQSMLPSVLLNLIRKGLESETSNPVSLALILQEIQKLSSGSVPVVRKEERSVLSQETTKIERCFEPVVNVSSDDADDFGDLLDLLK